ncbi:hypothetical protein [Paenibacillus mucilaginosus]|uniref:Uncharacterized protein n=3 Tax=Paenibacillus mucilaginosus TaxID=61624 RepID=H6NTD2_9BACL|nr:hypothetical protein [Paenibacillus mucilaginosus]AEI39317.1 hypothetical protein KNP414_00727 [Paenibacillus mucilaginosus KNP414]AFC27594.1 hypothetical protein PM3016_630 [Paenibacillus mucilaginosus 3016]AFH59749.1 hypothetical protein B2K_03235 [Paenibacillus mucilaginosus K02]MCG7216978.1 hypothetical protein [Paenibacillus mucilaginosus]WDM28312.1 hypothetical protein KCX80_03455 [Paenibacillus mucilaginosus]
MLNSRTLNGEQRIMVELTLKEAMALASGIHFHAQPQIAAGARRKVRSKLETILLPEADKLAYQLLEV